MFGTTYINVITLAFFPGKWISWYSAVRKPWEIICIASIKLNYGFGEPGTRQKNDILLPKEYGSS